MNIIPIDIGKDFYPRLANRNNKQGDGKHTAIEFRQKYLANLDNQTSWENDNNSIIFDFKNVKKIGPSFANEAIAYFTKYATPKKILQKINIINASNIHMRIIKQELDTAYYETK